jgi:hypothetical protein
MSGKSKDVSMGPNQQSPVPPTYNPPTPRAGSSPRAANGSTGPTMTRGASLTPASDFAKAAGKK